MLQAIRSRGASLVVKALFAVLIATFVIWGIGDIFRLRATRPPVVATVGGHQITAQDLQNALQPVLDRLSAQLGRTFDLKQAKRLGVVDAVLAQLIDRELADREVRRLQLDVSDDVIRSAILGNPSFRTPSGTFDRALFNEVLARNNLSEEQFIALLRRDIPRADLYRAITAGAAPPPPLLTLLYRYQNEKRIADIVALPAAAVGGIGQPSAAELEKYYKAHPDLFRAPEYRGFTLASLVPDDIAKDFKVPEAKLKEEYEERRDQFVIPERRQVQQILAPSEAKAKAVEAALAAGTSWRQAATTIAGQDPATIDLGLVKPQDLPKPLADAAFALPLDKPSQPIKSPLGWHILRVVKIVPAKTESFAEAKPELTLMAARSEAAERIDKIGNHVDDALAGGMSLGATIKKFGLKATTIAAADEHGMTPQGRPVSLPIAPGRVLQLVFSSEEGRTSRVYHTDDGGIFVIRVDKITPPHVRPLAAVKEQAIAAWRADKRRQKIDEEAKALIAAVNSGTPLKEAAKQRGLQVTTSPPLSRRAADDTGVPPQLVAKLFAAKPGAAVMIADASGAYVAQLEKVEVPAAPKPAATASLAEAAKAALKADLAYEFTAALRRRYPVEIHHTVLERLF
jgi:peptidyl-prolyl cis-trans isomerase D